MTAADCKDLGTVLSSSLGGVVAACSLDLGQIYDQVWRLKKAVILRLRRIAGISRVAGRLDFGMHQTLGQERHRGLQDLLKQPEASEFLNNATLAATEDSPTARSLGIQVYK